MKTPSLVFAVAALALAGGAYVALESGGSPPGTTRAPTAASDSARQPVVPPHPAVQLTVARGDQTAVSEQTGASALEREVAALRRELAQLRAVVVDLRRHSQRPAEDLAPGTAVEKPRFGAHAQAEEEQQRREAMDVQESSFRRERADPAWSSQTASKVEEALAGLAVDPSDMRDLECRASTCRLELGGDLLLTPEGDEPMSLDKGLPLLAMQLAGSLPNMTAFLVADGNGRTHTVLYFSRESDQPPPSGQ